MISALYLSQGDTEWGEIIHSGGSNFEERKGKYFFLLGHMD